jgi:hypothetical protein
MRVLKPSVRHHAAPSREGAVFCCAATPGAPTSPYPETEAELARQRRLNPHKSPDRTLILWILLEQYREVGLRYSGELINPNAYPEAHVRGAIESFFRQQREEREASVGIGVNRRQPSLSRQKGRARNRVPARGQSRSPNTRTPKD